MSEQEQLQTIRRSLGYSQSAMAKSLGISLRAYQDLEAGAVKMKGAYLLAAEMVALREAAGRGDPMLISSATRSHCMAISHALVG